MAKTKEAIHLSIPVSRKVLKKLVEPEGWESLIQTIEDWAEESKGEITKKGKVIEQHKAYDSYIRCPHRNQTISVKVCDNSITSRKRGCCSCKVGKLRKKIQELNTQLDKELTGAKK